MERGAKGTEQGAWSEEQRARSVEHRAWSIKQGVQNPFTLYAFTLHALRFTHYAFTLLRITLSQHCRSGVSRDLLKEQGA